MSLHTTNNNGIRLTELLNDDGQVVAIVLPPIREQLLAQGMNEMCDATDCPLVYESLPRHA